ncbi:Ig-like domain-containing protein [Alloalcanivorax venustensis]|jgi:hypothetical protein|uniref:Ig-like domain-containing protein n=1 Tax=Alloalcanivorax TaxID=3020832 RepID=UPI002EA59AE5|nr:Ig-like domain-containing protein [Pseudomonadota bacterium]
MKTTILKQSLLLLSSATLLAACGGDGGDSPVDDFGSNPGESGAQALLYAYPDNGQGEVPTKAPIALRFTSDVSTGDVKENVTLCCDDQGENLDFDADPVGGEPRGVLITPTDELAPGTQYTIDIADLRLKRGTAKDQTLTFTTRTLQEGPKSLVVQDMENFELSRTFPDGSKLEPVMDFSAFRFQFTQPIDRTTATYGDGNTVVIKDSEGMEVDAGLLVDGAYMTVDPTADYLTPGETYTLTLGAGLMSTYGEPFAEQTIEFNPKDSSPRGEPGFLVQRITQNDTSRLTGKPINQVPVNGVLLGEEGQNFTQAEASHVIAELADVTQYTEVTPIRLPKGTLLKGLPIDMVKIGGEVEAGFGSGDVTMRVLSDATGYLVPNPYTENHPDKLRIVHLFMDVGIATENPKANAGFTQNLLHIHLVGVAEVNPSGGVLNIDATSMVEPDILGQEYGYGLLSFQLQSYKNQTAELLQNARAALQDDTSPQMQSWVPDTNIAAFKASDPVIINFDEPLSSETVNSGTVFVRRDGAEIPSSIKVDGSAIVIRPEAGFLRSSQGATNEYEIEVSSGVTDLAGNQVSPTALDAFRRPELAQSMTQDAVNPNTQEEVVTDEIERQRSPIVLHAYPGFPCALEDGGLDPQNNVVGRCDGALSGWNQGQEPDIRRADDLLPLPSLASNQPIIVQFSQNMDAQSFEVGETFKVYQIDNAGNISAPVDGHIDVESKSIIFWPSEPWEEDKLYSYSLVSNGDASSSNVDCSTAVCSEDGLPLQTRLWEVSTDPVISAPAYATRDFLTSHLPTPPTAGGPLFTQYFRGDQRSNSVIQMLSTPSADRNANFYLDKVAGELDLEMRQNFDPIDQLGFRYVTAIKGDQEVGAQDQPYISNTPTSDYPGMAREDIDPEGVVPPKNSAKILSLMVETESFGAADFAINGGTKLFALGLRIGCGYGDITAPDMENFFGKHIVREEPCPREKFTYLNSSVVAEVTDEFVEGKGLKVKLWPGQIMATSISQRIASGGGVGFVPSGPQVMRMRYSKADESCVPTALEPCARTKPITGWISTGSDTPRLKATVDLYIDAPLLNINIGDNLDIGNQQQETDLLSYPVTMELSGDIVFKDDGTMVVEQYNLQDVNIDISLVLRGAEANVLELMIPAYGSRLVYETSKIK